MYKIPNVKKEIIKKYNITDDYMIMVGASYPHKNLEMALYALKDLEEECKLVVVGKDSKYILKLKALATELNIEDKVKFIKIYLRYIVIQKALFILLYMKALVYQS